MSDCAWCGKDPSKSWVKIGGRYFCWESATCVEQFFFEKAIGEIH